MRRSVKAVSMATSEYFRCPPRRPPVSGSHAAMASGGHPHSDVASADQGPLVRGPVANVVLGFVLRMDPRLHILIVYRRLYTGRGDQRALPGQGGTTVHQRVCRESPVKGDKMP